MGLAPNLGRQTDHESVKLTGYPCGVMTVKLTECRLGVVCVGFESGAYTQLRGSQGAQTDSSTTSRIGVADSRGTFLVARSFLWA